MAVKNHSMPGIDHDLSPNQFVRCVRCDALNDGLAFSYMNPEIHPLFLHDGMISILCQEEEGGKLLCYSGIFGVWEVVHGVPDEPIEEWL